MELPVIWAHRGAVTNFPENTMEAFQRAVELNVYGIELDVQLSKDGKLVVIHDETLDRTCLNGKGYVKDYTLDQLKSFNVGDPKKGIEWAHIPTLDEVLELLESTTLHLNIELKTGIIDYEGIEEKTIEAVKLHHMEDRVLYSSFNYITIQNIKKLKPAARCGYLYWQTEMDMPSYTVRTGMEALHPDIVFLKDKTLTEACHANQIEVNVWTVDQPDDIRLCIEQGVHGIFTNDIETTRRIYDEYK